MAATEKCIPPPLPSPGAFIVHRSGATGVKIALQSVADKEKFVRQHGGTIDGHGNGGPACYFIVHKHEEDSTVSLQAREALESGSEDKFFLAVNAEGNPLLPSEAGPGPASRFHIEIVPEAKFHAPAAAGLSDGIHCRLENKASNKLLRLLPGVWPPACLAPVVKGIVD